MFHWKKQTSNVSLLRLWSGVPVSWITKIEDFFTDNQNYLQILKNINDKEKNETYISLRKINFFVTMYSKIHQVTGSNQIFIYHNYNEQLNYYRRKYFDPFRRGQLQVDFCVNGISGVSTFPQLNFFLWFFSNKLYEFVQENIDKITTNMAIVTKEHRKKKNKIQKENNGEKKRLMYNLKASDCIAVQQEEVFTY